MVGHSHCKFTSTPLHTVYFVFAILFEKSRSIKFIFLRGMRYKFDILFAYLL